MAVTWKAPEGALAREPPMTGRFFLILLLLLLPSCRFFARQIPVQKKARAFQEPRDGVRVRQHRGPQQAELDEVHGGGGQGHQ